MASILQRITSRISFIGARHPVLREAILWSLPAVFAGLLLRLLFLHYSPYAFWGADSRSYFGFTHGVLENFYFSINEKRRYLYPLFLFPITLLPGGTLKALAWIQAGLGLLTILPLAYAIRKLFVGWRWYVIPLTLAYAGMPLLIWQEHELIADSIFFDCFAWALAGWVAFVSQKESCRGSRLFWWFFGPLAILMLTKPSGVFLWPGLLAGLFLVRTHLVFNLRHWLALVVLLLASFTAGDRTQSAWLLYMGAFPLTRLDTPLHADYKKEIHDLVEEKRRLLSRYNEDDYDINRFLRGPEDQTERPLWQELGKDKTKMAKVYRDLAIEAIAHQPARFLQIGLQKMLGSCNPGDFNIERFKADYSGERMELTYREEKVPESMLRLAFGIPKEGPFPPLKELQERISPYPDSLAAQWLVAYGRGYHKFSNIIVPPTNPEDSLMRSKPTFLGWLLLGGVLLSVTKPWRNTLGVWAAASALYLVPVYLMGIQQTRYFALVWPVCFLALAVVPDALLRVWRAKADQR